VAKHLDLELTVPGDEAFKTLLRDSATPDKNLNDLTNLYV